MFTDEVIYSGFIHLTFSPIFPGLLPHCLTGVQLATHNKIIPSLTLNKITDFTLIPPFFPFLFLPLLHRVLRGSCLGATADSLPETSPNRHNYNKASNDQSYQFIVKCISWMDWCSLVKMGPT